ncbi:hypothetical protein LTR36_002535 [Oleoguttula mirabilis]|uniref:Uncharacterized protein n=1 Tax=Oleoguttula mirabilis TaxID=1507867 RepID=A0AAV9JLS5_9PEZI|nr:hypothetical protein LTR36_002535 [Oleoguttula mirabilis]
MVDELLKLYHFGTSLNMMSRNRSLYAHLRAVKQYFQHDSVRHEEVMPDLSDGDFDENDDLDYE